MKIKPILDKESFIWELRKINTEIVGLRQHQLGDVSFPFQLEDHVDYVSYSGKWRQAVSVRKAYDLVSL